MIYRGPVFLAVVWFASTPTPYPPIPTSDILYMQEDWERETTFCREEGDKGLGEKPNHTTARKLGPLSIIQFNTLWQPNSTCGFAAFEDILACWVHARGNVDGVAPDVVVELRGADDAAGDVTKVETDAEDEIEFDEGLVEVLHHALQAE
jgi:hypothetical protein